MDYLLSTLELEKINIRDVSEPGVEANIVEMTYPGRPVIMYLNQRVGVYDDLSSAFPLRGGNCCGIIGSSLFISLPKKSSFLGKGI